MLMASNEPVLVGEQLSIEGHSPYENNSFYNRKESVPQKSVEKGFLSEQMSLERGSPPAFEPEVIIVPKSFSAMTKI